MKRGNSGNHESDDRNQNGSERKQVVETTGALGSSRTEIAESFKSEDGTVDNNRTSVTLSPKMIQDQRIKEMEHERRERAKQQRQQELRHNPMVEESSPDETSSATSVINHSSSEDDHRTRSGGSQSRPYPNQMEKYWDKQFGRESVKSKTDRDNLFASVMSSVSTLDANMDAPNDDPVLKQGERKNNIRPIPVAPGAYAQVGPTAGANNTDGGSASPLDEENASPLETRTSSNLVHANKVDDAQAIVDATDVQRDNFKRRLLIGAVFIFAVSLALGLYFGLNSNKSQVGAPDCDGICCAHYEVPIGHLAPLSCSCFGTTQLIYDRHDGFEQHNFDKAKSYFMELLTSQEKIMISSESMKGNNISFVSSAMQELELMQGNSCHPYDQVLLMFASNVTFEMYMNKRRSSIRNSHLMLASLFIATNGINWTQSKGWFDVVAEDEEDSEDEVFDLCDWFGLQCLFENHANVLDLSENNLNGTLSPMLFLFTGLQELDVSGNLALSGRIPNEIGNLFQLTSLSIAETNLYGTIPSELASIRQLHELTLVGHDDPCSGCHGEIPPSLFDNPFLRSVDISLHGLVSPLPSEIQLASNLRTLTLSAAGLIGLIPTEIGVLTSLKVLDLSYNKFDFGGSIPSELSNLPELVFLNVAYSGLNETIPESFCDVHANTTKTQLLVATSCQHPLCSCCRNLTGRITTASGGYMIDITCVQPNHDWMEELAECTDEWWLDD
ncbi:unnamed protein product [Cylindrotheca closterium]|uniref:L domain-like protein n=1 Tax=Cylindrotheca closterium TaxID=2856 RepID=A0AAD2FVJ1_9STRA|nr:unnamed protein product [Cylindrotheca closterium]